ncbi:hypothetical protein ACFO3J_20910 [Streptomyces polygonati]|uniref:Uncharacterized protein n=1 Tax=Streptomyces polygonati TaxID=1617087 RepID=A0ABV8HPH3_9ACTN
MPEPETAMPVSPARPAPTDAPYWAEAARADGQWHLTVRSLDDHPDRGEVDALVVTVTGAGPGDGLPAAELDHMLRDCGFARDGDWEKREDHWTAPCRQPNTWGAPPAPPGPV